MSKTSIGVIVIVALLTVAVYIVYPGLIEPEPEQVQEVPGLGECSGTLTILYDNNAYDADCRTEWGFSALIELEGYTILFDTGGDPEVLSHNIDALDVDVQEIDCIVISHEHWDHVGGLDLVLGMNSNVTVYLPESIPYRIKSSVRSRGAEIVETSDPVKICEGVSTTSVLEADPDEQALILGTENGLILVTGCSHPGVENLARDAAEVTGTEVYMVVGGFHLGGQDRASLDALVEEMKEIGVTKAAPTHCSGDLARLAFSEGYGDDYLGVGVGFSMGF
ncbi:MBL fold metallo-hydrolase [Candidatus Bathyarchaeota archaeon]|nr:MBL fold metallo-hydrolase [Candidatus Bathyarchaeota archaeon]